METSQYRVLADYEVHDPHPLRLSTGTSVRIVRVDLGWPGWVWVESGEQSGWMPEYILQKQDDSLAETLRPFDGGDLSARRGDILEAVEEAPGWILAKDKTGQTGWFPMFNLKPSR